jgi:hypothetical protein
MLYAVLELDRTTFHKRWSSNPDHIWSFPTPSGEPGDWTPKVEGRLAPRSVGYALIVPGAITGWLGPKVFVAQHSGERVIEGDHVIVRSARLLRRTPWSYEAAANWFTNKLDEVMDHCALDMADEAKAFHREFTEREVTGLTKGDTHEIKGFVNGERLLQDLENDIMQQIRTKCGKVTADVFSLANYAVRHLRMNNPRSVEGALTAFNRCVGHMRDAFMKDMFLWEEPKHKHAKRRK